MKLSRLSTILLAMPFMLSCMTASAHAKAPAGAVDVSLQSEDDYSIAGWYYDSKFDASPAVILLHMRGSDKSANSQLAATLQAEGYAVLAIDLRGHGESRFPDGSNPGHEKLTSADYLAMLRDIRAAHDYLNSRDDVDGERIAIVGASIGANLAIMYAASDRRVRTVVALSPGQDYFGLQPGVYLEDFGKRPLYLVCAEGDEYSWQSCVALEKLATLADPVSLRVFPGKAHGSDLLESQDGLDDTIVSGWMLNYLPPKR